MATTHTVLAPRLGMFGNSPPASLAIPPAALSQGSPTGSNLTPGPPYGGFTVPPGGPWYIIGPTAYEVEYNLTNILRGINIEQGVVTYLFVKDYGFDCHDEYAFYGGSGIEQLVMHNVRLRSKGTGDAYGMRVAPAHIIMDGCTVDNDLSNHKGCFRAYGCFGGQISNCVFRGDQLEMGGGVQAGGGTPHPFYNVHWYGNTFDYTHGNFNGSMMELRPGMQNNVMSHCDFICSGTRAGWVHDPAPVNPPNVVADWNVPPKDLRYHNCRFRFYNEAQFVPLDASHFGGSAAAKAARLQITSGPP